MNIFLTTLLNVFVMLLAGRALAEEPTKIEAQEEPFETEKEYNFGLGVAYLSDIGNEYNHYEKLFGKPNIYPEFWADYSPLSWKWFDLSLGLHIGYYRDTGHSAKRTEEQELQEGGLSRDLTDEDVDKTQKSRLALIPVQGVASIGISPFTRRWIVANFWGGIGFTYVENTTEADLGSDVSQSDIQPYLNSGWNRERVLGASLSIDLSWISARDAYSLKVHGIEAIYLTPFYQKVVTSKNKVGIYDRTMLGLMFTFESRQ